MVPHYEVGCLEPIRFRSAALHDGPEGFLSRRSRKFRSNLRRALKRGRDAGLEFERCVPYNATEAHHAFERMVAVERTSWKGLENCGMTEEPYLAFYRSVYRRMCENSVSRAIFVRLEGKDIGFVMGGVDGTSYRGQQFSFGADWEELSLGNLLQWEMIKWLCERKILRYDLGSVLEYKTHWAEIETLSHTLVWRPNV
jgi:CelD/BcsL family acetyltransferase involved in cellulose biosynthesis